ncbi:hypothetical protein M409DRAFT_19269 [Zasmidium cellare ATCC 36951]|uniref:Xylanolytic transcriptional activator regulatory domain-containing protein n=1 Tax=Zasmidium cellare ATCC 36951 TaxID=1080233 RepID=A0A6A6CW65_ZASCE|nr:uncharacterized protein M409DRAFT_19269 [Zasmidium cellare ATCC 36951]KAF2170448.1 hypothetical protein M409DRAFT_19269 [Zasmidium cellare ATCC 36951]
MTTRSPEVIGERSPLLFWVICAVASEDDFRAQLAPRVKQLVLNTISSPVHSVETVQALLLLCLWPFRASFRSDDPSYFYSGLATQIGMLLGLHRPAQTHAYRHEWDSHPVPGFRVKTTTWLACFVINHQLAYFNGVPPSLVADTQLLAMLNEPTVNPTLAQLCRIYCLLAQSLKEISCDGVHPSGLQDPSTRMQMIQRFTAQLTALRTTHLEPMNDMIKVVFLHARIQVHSFALHDDMSPSPELRGVLIDLENDSCDLIDLCHDMNLAVAPNHFWLAVAYCGCVIVRILQSPLCTQRETLEDKFTTMQQALRSVAASNDDMSIKAVLVLQALRVFKDIKQTPPILSRMSAWISYDCRRIYWENWTRNGFGQHPIAGRPSIELVQEIPFSNSASVTENAFVWQT